MNNGNPRDAFTPRIPRVFVLEGGESVQIKGWRHYQFIVDGNKKGTSMAKPDAAPEIARKMGGKFFPAGTWEDFSKPVAPDTMPVPRPEILKEIFPENPETEKRQLAFA